MSGSGVDLRRQIAVAGELQDVVRTMRALAASRISEYEQSVQALAAYAADVERGLGLCLRGARMQPTTASGRAPPVRALVFGSDQGLVGPFNDAIVQHAARTLRALAGPVPELHAVGERVAARLDDAGLPVAAAYPVPGSVDEVGALVARIQLATEAPSPAGEPPMLHVFHNRPMPAGLYEPAHEQLLPLDAAWAASLAARPWPGARAAEAVGPRADTLRALLGEHLFVGLVRACAESLASENAARLAAMQRAEKNIGELLQALQSAQRRARQERIDEELFDLLAGYEGLEAARVGGAR